MELSDFIHGKERITSPTVLLLATKACVSPDKADQMAVLGADCIKDLRITKA